MAQKKQPFDLSLTADADAGSNDVKMDRVPSGWLYCIQHTAVENETTDFTDFRIMKGGVGGEFLLEEQELPEGGVLYWTNEGYYLHEGQYLLVRFTGCSAGDKLRVYLTGWRQIGRELNA